MDPSSWLLVGSDAVVYLDSLDLHVHGTLERELREFEVSWTALKCHHMRHFSRNGLCGGVDSFCKVECIHLRQRHVSHGTCTPEEPHTQFIIVKAFVRRKRI
jgi:hypothetical protein